MIYTLSNWDKKFIAQCNLVASWSKDPRHKVGCVIADTNHFVTMATGYNGFPREVKDSDARLENKELKNKLIIHAEASVRWNVYKINESS